MAFALPRVAAISRAVLPSSSSEVEQENPPWERDPLEGRGGEGRGEEGRGESNEARGRRYETSSSLLIILPYSIQLFVLNSCIHTVTVTVTGKWKHKVS